MKTISSFLTLSVLLLSGCFLSPTVSFKKDVHPILLTNCAICHSPGGNGYKKSGYGVLNYETVMKRTSFGPVIIPRSSINSSLMILLEHKADPQINMPKDFTVLVKDHEEFVIPSASSKSLSPAELKTIKDWIDQGALNN